MEKVLLISMPFAALERPALGISLLKSGLDENGVECDIRYFTIDYAEHIGFESYQWINSELPYTAFAGDWLFTTALYGDQSLIDQGYVDEVLRDTWRLDESSIWRLVQLRTQVSRFLDYCMLAIDWTAYKIVGFTSTFSQNIASLALAKRIKQEHEEIQIFFGGANWEGEMGVELHRQFPFVDFVCSGEADESFPRLVQAVLSETPTEIPQIKGIVYRSAEGLSVFTGYGAPIEKMDELPIPDFTAYFKALNESTIGHEVLPHLLIETSRGCWWGAKSHCTFCGLNGNGMNFRSKSADRAFHELLYLVDTWQIEMVEVVDNILDMQHVKDLLPRLAEEERYIRLFYEVKANLTRAQLEVLKQAGVYRIQPGIESLSDHVLKLMRKGTSGLRNIQLLKWCKEYGIGVDWNVLYGFPGETEHDYQEMLELLPAIRFLEPPTGYGAIRMDRFSPYYDYAEQFGLYNIRPMLPYPYLYPFDEASLMRIAYYFEFDYKDEVAPKDYAHPVVSYVRDWQAQPEFGALWSIEQPDGTLLLQDTRTNAGLKQVGLMGLEKSVFDYCDQMRTLPSINRHLKTNFPEEKFSDDGVRNYLSSLVDNQLMVTDGTYYLSLALSKESL